MQQNPHQPGTWLAGRERAICLFLHLWNTYVQGLFNGNIHAATVRVYTAISKVINKDLRLRGQEHKYSPQDQTSLTNFRQRNKNCTSKPVSWRFFLEQPSRRITAFSYRRGENPTYLQKGHVQIRVEHAQTIQKPKLIWVGREYIIIPTCIVFKSIHARLRGNDLQCLATHRLSPKCR